MIYGNVEGTRKSVLERLEELYSEKIDKSEVLNGTLVDTIVSISNEINREISVSIDRKGNIVTIAIGDSSTVEISDIEIIENKLPKIRVIHTHPNGNPNLSYIDLSALTKLKLDCIVSIGVGEDKTITGYSVAVLERKEEILSYRTFNFKEFIKIRNFDYLSHSRKIEESLNKYIDESVEKAILVGTENQDSLDELEELAKACNVESVEKILQIRKKIDSTFYIGKGKAAEIATIRQTKGANLVIFDEELSGSQVRNLEDAIGIKVIDRTTLILEIFARRSKTKESKIQVELAQLKYRLPRLIGLSANLSRTGGGIGTRGPGEKKLETDKRHIRDRIYDLKCELETMKKVRVNQRQNRGDIPKIALVGYTNAGKSTLRNKLCEIYSPKGEKIKDEVFSKDMLFATLDTTTRKISLVDGKTAALTDTVGFINKLPHDLVESFKSTLDEVISADLLLHVIDGSSLNAVSQIESVYSVLEELNVLDKPIINIINKIDTADDENIKLLEDSLKEENIIKISARESINLDLLTKDIVDSLPYKIKKLNFIIPYDKQNLVNYLHENAKVSNEEYVEEGTKVEALVDQMVLNKLEKYIINNDY
ncbi:MAG: GTPase HflX [Clostridiaceae bacterium]